MLEIKKIDTASPELESVKKLFLEYLNELDENLHFQSVHEELENPLDKYGKPDGCLLLAYRENDVAGCIAYHQLQQQGICEMKRLYVRPTFRNYGIGDGLIRALLRDAAERNYQKMVLDTLKRLESATKLYVAHGFVETGAYYENPLPDVVYMEKDLSHYGK